MKKEFFEYIGTEDSLASYSRSYKLIFLKSLLATMDATGKAGTFQVVEQFKSFYITRKKSGKSPDANVDTRIENIEHSSNASILSVILDNPYKAIAGKGFVKQREFDGLNYFVLSPDLVSELTQEDIAKLNNIIDKKIQLYFSRIDGDTMAVDMQSLFNRMLDSYYDSRTSQAFAGNATGELFRKKAPAILEKVPTFDGDTYLIKGSVGQGNWATVPWICIFDKRITTTAQHGVYIVYLLSEKGDKLYLTFNQGCTKHIEELGKKKAIQKMQEIANDIRSKIKTDRFIARNDFVLGNEYYEQGSIFYKEYAKGNVPSNDELIADFEEMLKIYQQYYTIMTADKTSSIEEAPREDQSLEIIESYIVSDELTRIAEYIASKGFSYEGKLIENFYLSLKAKPFVILAGTSGTGKTKLVKLFAEAIGANTANGRLKLVPVHPDWSDSTDLFGHVDLNGHYVPGILTNFIKAAMADHDKPYFLCLDEMNLARVEYYFCDILSVIETRRIESEKIMTDPLIAAEVFGRDEAAKTTYGNLYLPENLYIVGTVNMDETTFPFSKRYLIAPIRSNFHM